MNYGEILSGTFRAMWREKRLFLFGLIGTLLVSAGTMIYMATILNWQRSMFDQIATAPNSASPDRMMGGVFLLLGSMGLFFVAALIGYFVNLVMRGATIGEARIAWEGGKANVGRGTRTGLSRAIYLFLIDLLWSLPGIIVIGGTYLAGLVAFILPATAVESGAAPDDPMAAFSAVMGGIFIFLCALLCVSLLYTIARGIFSPLMYQSAVQGRRSLGHAIKEGWKLARSNLGAMLIFGIILFALYLVVAVIMQIASFPLAFGMMSSMFSSFGSLAAGQEPAAASPISGVLMILGAVLYGIVFWLLTAFRQTFGLVLYAEVYRRLAASGAETPSGAFPPAAVEPAAPLEPAA